jgi:hypothetical protein
LDFDSTRNSGRRFRAAPRDGARKACYTSNAYDPLVQDAEAMFGISTVRDYYAMLVEDFDEFMAEPGSARRAIHCAMTAYHMYEWAWSDLVKENDRLKERIGAKKKKEFVQWIGNDCIWFECVADLASGSKHFLQDFETMRVGGFDRDFDLSFGGTSLLIDFGVANRR